MSSSQLSSLSLLALGNITNRRSTSEKKSSKAFPFQVSSIISNNPSRKFFEYVSNRILTLVVTKLVLNNEARSTSLSENDWFSLREMAVDFDEDTKDTKLRRKREKANALAKEVRESKLNPGDVPSLASLAVSNKYTRNNGGYNVFESWRIDPIQRVQELKTCFFSAASVMHAYLVWYHTG
jgi:hypothetical protein